MPPARLRIPVRIRRRAAADAGLVASLPGLTMIPPPAGSVFCMLLAWLRIPVRIRKGAAAEEADTFGGLTGLTMIPRIAGKAASFPRRASGRSPRRERFFTKTDGI